MGSQPRERRMKKLPLVLAFVSLPIASIAAPPIGRGLALCEGFHQRESCNLYISAFLEGVRAAQTASESGHAICIPPNASDEKLQTTIQTYAREHDPLTMLPEPSVAEAALIAAYPCKKPK